MEQKKKVSIWLRVSSDWQVERDSPKHHEARARHYASSKDWEIVEVYQLNAVSGKSVMDHPETKRMLSDLRNKRFTGLIFSNLSRLARNTTELLSFAQIFNEENADLISLSESIDTSTPAGRLFYTLMSASATFERETIASRVAASVPVRARLGKPLGGASTYGYKWIGNDLVIDEKEGPVRKLVYELFLKFRRKKTTSSELNRLGYRTRNGSKFSDTTVDRLIRDTTAKGMRRANYTKSTGDGKKWIVKDKKDWIMVPCPAIVSEELWDDCNRVLDSQYKKRNKPGPMAVHLLSGFITCHCGMKMYVRNSPVYKCGKCKNRIAIADIDEIYHDQLKTFLLTDSDLEAYSKQSDSILREKQLLLSGASNEATEIRKKMKEFVEMRVNKELSPDRFKEFYQPLEEKLDQIEKQLPELEAEIDFLKIQNLSSDSVVKEARNLYERWPKIPFEEKRTIVELITEQVVVGNQEINIKLSYLPNVPSNLNGINRQHIGIPALPFYTLQKTLKKPLGSKYTDEPSTLGEKLRNKRLELGLLQRDVAAIVKVTEDTVTNWENNRCSPKNRSMTLVLEFLNTRV